MVSPVIVSAFWLITKVLSWITKVTLLKLALLFVKSAAVKAIGYVPAAVPLTLWDALADMLKSAALYSGLLIDTIVYPLTVCDWPS